MSMLEVKNITVGYGRRNILENISFSAKKGTLTCILGANGSGKTTLLKAMCGILPHGGMCTLAGKDLGGLSPRKLSRLVSYTGQRSGIAIDIQLLDVVLMGFNPWLPLLGQPDESMAAKACAALDLVGLGERKNENYMTLSEGQRQLCILARTLASPGELLLLDEPESALDIRHRHQMLDILKNWAGEDHWAVLTLHDPNLALEYCDNLVLLGNGQVTAVLHPKTDSIPAMEAALSKIYGSVTVCRCQDRTGNSHLVMLKDREEIR